MLRSARHIFDNSHKLLNLLNRNHGSTVPYKKEREWKIFNQLNKLSFNFGNYGILVLNRPISICPDIVSSLWHLAKWRITVDGGTNRLFHYTEKHSLNLPLPNCVTGDLDSIKPEILNFCEKQNEILIVCTSKQDCNDFNKALNVLLETCPVKLDCYVAISEHSGRLDHTFTNINTLSRTPLQGYLLSESDVTWLLQPGFHRIHIPGYLCNKEEWCGILPFSSLANVTTTGLKWNLNNTPIEFGKVFSSSNTYNGNPEVQLTTDGTVIWTMSYGQ
ncbi:thiamin pyrophosphokinase 1 isoform X1 [Halyomorpha halys]|uniref:thiamin pyrophosphokinase 1 isoform X1 n=1 Tax=Halyomorpha halys TaxID=286706 RepID=UPI0006D503E9|nr:thiamin pyrophosphokinase 1-like [Halyomorpha halys]